MNVFCMFPFFLLCVIQIVFKSVLGTKIILWSVLPASWTAMKLNGVKQNIFVRLCLLHEYFVPHRSFAVHRHSYRSYRCCVHIGIIMKEIQSLLGHLSKEIDRKEATLQNFEHHFGSAMQKANDVCHHLVQLNAHRALCKSLWQVNNVVRHICTKFFICLMHFLYLWPGYIP